jgi:hypothetical protein
MPINWYAALVLIVILGIVSVVFARYEYRHPSTASTTPPTKGTTWYAAFDFDICGTQKTPLPSNVTDATKQSFYTTGSGVITVSPKSTADSGHNAVFGKFVSGYSGMALTATAVTVPSGSSSTTTTTTTTTAPTTTTTTSSKDKKTSTAHTYRNGETCPAGTKDAGKKADVEVSSWANAFASKEKATKVTGDPATLEFSNDQLITIGFVPAGTTLPKPSGTVVTALLQAATASSTTTTTTAPTTTTTTTTTAPTTTTTTAPTTTTTTTAPTTTTTTSPKKKS